MIVNEPSLIPMTVDEVDKDWLEKVLNAAGHKVELQDFSTTRTRRSGSSQVFCEVTYRVNDSGVANRFCIKSCMEEDSAQLAALGIFEAEVTFYRDIAAAIALRTPMVYAIVWDDVRRINTLVMEDLAVHGARFGHIAGSLLDEAEAESLICGLAELHSRFWDAGHSNEPGVRDLDVGYAAGNWMHDLYARFDERYLAQMLGRPRTANYPPHIRVARLLHSAFWTMASASGDGELCVIHGDPHIGNIFVVEGEAGLCDWQCIRRGRWEHDVAYMICSSLPIDLRRRIDRQLIALYCDRMGRHGITIAFEDAWDKYREGIMYGLFGWTTTEDAYHYEEDEIGRYATAFATAASDHGTVERLIAKGT